MVKEATSGKPNWGASCGNSLLFFSGLNGLNSAALTAEQIKGLLKRLVMPASQLAQCLQFQNQVMPKLGIVKPVVMVRPPQTATASVLSYNLADVVLSIFALLMQEESKYVQASCIRTCLTNLAVAANNESHSALATCRDNDKLQMLNCLSQFGPSLSTACAATLTVAHQNWRNSWITASHSHPAD